MFKHLILDNKYRNRNIGSQCWRQGCRITCTAGINKIVIARLANHELPKQVREAYRERQRERNAEMRSNTIRARCWWVGKREERKASKKRMRRENKGHP